MVTAAAVLRGLGSGTFYALMFTMVGDVIEYGHWRTGVRAEGLLFSANTIGQKIGSGVALAIIGAVMTASGFDGMIAVQPAAAVSTISAVYIWGPIVCWGGMAILGLLDHKLDVQYDSIMCDLHEGKLSPKAKLQEKIRVVEAKPKKHAANN